ncbi:MAG: hypothetical protein IJT28_08160 [Bacteroidaceae bacterium]|nr:hypothetical protein [Bacteroidaceae bacterium]
MNEIMMLEDMNEELTALKNHAVNRIRAYSQLLDAIENFEASHTDNAAYNLCIAKSVRECRGMLLKTKYNMGIDKTEAAIWKQLISLLERASEE